MLLWFLFFVFQKNSPGQVFIDNSLVELVYDESLVHCFEAWEAFDLALTRTELYRQGKGLTFKMLRLLMLSLKLPVRYLFLVQDALS